MLLEPPLESRQEDFGGVQVLLHLPSSSGCSARVPSKGHGQGRWENHGLFNLENMVYQNILKYKSMNMGHENIVGWIWLRISGKTIYIYLIHELIATTRPLFFGWNDIIRTISGVLNIGWDSTGWSVNIPRMMTCSESLFSGSTKSLVNWHSELESTHV